VVLLVSLAVDSVTAESSMADSVVTVTLVSQWAETLVTEWVLLLVDVDVAENCSRVAYDLAFVAWSLASVDYSLVADLTDLVAAKLLQLLIVAVAATK